MLRAGERGTQPRHERGQYDAVCSRVRVQISTQALEQRRLGSIEHLSRCAKAILCVVDPAEGAQRAHCNRKVPAIRCERRGERVEGARALVQHA